MHCLIDCRLQERQMVAIPPQRQERLQLKRCRAVCRNQAVCTYLPAYVSTDLRLTSLKCKSLRRSPVRYGNGVTHHTLVPAVASNNKEVIFRRPISTYFAKRVLQGMWRKRVRPLEAPPANQFGGRRSFRKSPKPLRGEGVFRSASQMIIRLTSE